jgi:hypothetical protein
MKNSNKTLMGIILIIFMIFTNYYIGYAYKTESFVDFSYSYWFLVLFILTITFDMLLVLLGISILVDWLDKWLFKNINK